MKKHAQIRKEVDANTARFNAASPGGDKTASLTLDILTEILGALLAISDTLAATQGKVTATKPAQARKTTTKAK